MCTNKSFLIGRQMPPLPPIGSQAVTAEDPGLTKALYPSPEGMSSLAWRGGGGGNGVGVNVLCDGCDESCECVCVMAVMGVVNVSV